MNLKVGIVGLANVGKSTLFNAILKKQVAYAANYPFATIEPNIGVVPVPDSRLDFLADMVEKEEGVVPPKKPATVEFVDIAGLVKGASQGEGLGNKFLSHIREVSLICHVVRFFTDDNIIHVSGRVNPKEDKEVVETELILADLQTLNKQVEPKGKVDKEMTRRWDLITKLKDGLNGGKPAREIVTEEDERTLIRDLQLLTMKPVIYVANVSEESLKKYSSSQESTTSREAVMREFSKGSNNMIAISAQIESELAALSDEEQKAYLAELGVSQSGLERLIAKAYETLGLISFLTAGTIEVRAWTIAKGMKAPQAAGVIHTDFEKKFIKAEVYAYNDLVAAGTRAKAKELGKLRLEGKEYVIGDGDVVEFKIGA